VLVQVSGLGRSIDAIILDACASLGIERWGGASADGWSKHSDFLRCAYRYYLKHIRGVAPLVVGAVSSSLDVGSCVHLLLAAHYARLLPDDRYPGWQQNSPEPTALLQALIAAGLPMQIAVEVERLYKGYVEKYGAETIAPVAVEMQAGTVGEHTSRYDLVFYIEDGLHDGLWIGEHKTMSPKTDPEDFRFDGEVLGEMFSWDLSNLQDFFGQRVNGVCVNTLVKVIPPRYQRYWFTFPQSLINEYGSNCGRWEQQMLLCEQSGVWPKTYACQGRYRRCRFWEHCRTQDDGQLVSLESGHA
jgi:hypothetical protein